MYNTCTKEVDNLDTTVEAGTILPAHNDQEFQAMSQLTTEVLLCALDTPTEVLHIIFNILQKMKKVVTTTEFTCKFGSHGEKDGQLNRQSGIAVFNDGRVIVCDTHNHRMQIFSPTGKFVCKFG